MKRIREEEIEITLLCDEEAIETNSTNTAHPRQKTFANVILEVHHPICHSLSFDAYCYQIGLLLSRLYRSSTTMSFCDCVCGLSLLLDKFWNDDTYGDLLYIASHITGKSITTIQQIERDVFAALNWNVCTNDDGEDFFTIDCVSWE